MTTTRPNPGHEPKSDLATLVARAAARDGKDPELKTRQPGDAALLASVLAAQRAQREQAEILELQRMRAELRKRYPSVE
jgi:hypothetical protein